MGQEIIVEQTFNLNLYGHGVVGSYTRAAIHTRETALDPSARRGSGSITLAG